MATTLNIREQRGRFYADVHTLNGTNIADGATIQEAFIGWRNKNKGWNPDKICLLLDGNKVTMTVNEFHQQYIGQ